MRGILKKYWDIIGGSATGITLSFLAKFELNQVQLVYSVIILMLVCIGVFRIIKQAIDKRLERKKNLIDDLVDFQKPIKAIHIAENPIQDGEELGELIVSAIKEKKVMKKLKAFFEKFKGYILTFAVALLGVIEAFGGFINDWFGDKLIINGINIVSVVALVCAIVIGCISNGFTREQYIKIKEVITNPNNKELVEEIKSQIKINEAKLKEINKELSNKEHELLLLDNQRSIVKKSYDAKKQLSNVITNDEIKKELQDLYNQLNNFDAQKLNLDGAIGELKTKIKIIESTINVLKQQL